MSLLHSGYVSVNGAREVTQGVLASAGFLLHQPNYNGVKGFYAAQKDVARKPLSGNFMDEKGEIVDVDASPQLIHDLTWDFAFRYGESTFRSATKYPGGSGVGFWQVNATPDALTPQVTSLTATAITVTAGGAVTGLLAGVLLLCVGFTNAANNGLRVVGAGSTATSITVSGGAIEASPPTGAFVIVCGYQGAATDIAVSAGGNLTSIANVFASLGLLPGMWLWLGGGTSAAPGLLGFTVVAADRGLARITAVTANQLTVDRRTASWSADPGTAKTIQIFFGPWWRNVPGLHADYKEPAHSLELVLPRIGAAGATDYCYANGATLGMLDIAAPGTDKMVATASFQAFNVTAPSTTRNTGPSTALAPIRTGALNTAAEMRRLWIANQSDETILMADIQDWSLSFNNNVKAYKKQGVTGNAGMIFGNFQPTLKVNGSLAQDDLMKACADFRNCSWASLARNSDGGILYDIPAFTVSSPGPDFPDNDVTKFSITSGSFRDSTYGFVGSQMMFPSLPTD